MYDHEYAWSGTAIFLTTEPLRGWRHAVVTDRRTRVDWAHVIKDLLDVHFPEAEQMVLLLNNLKIHSLGPRTRRSRPPRRSTP